MSALLCFILFVIVPHSVFGESEFPSHGVEFQTTTELSRFGVYFTDYLQQDGSTSRSALLLWSPAVHLDEHFSLITDLGFTYLHTPNFYFLALFLGERLDYRLTQSFSADLSVGAQHWTRAGGLSAMAGAGVSYHFDRPAFLSLQTIRGAAEYIWKTGYPTLQILVGVEFSFDSIEDSPSSNEAINAQVSNTVVKPRKSNPVSKLYPDMGITSKGFKLTLSSRNLSFASAKASLSPAGKKYVQSIANAFLDHDVQWTSISISGHTDNTGRPEKNDKLSRDRAKAVADIFKRIGVDPKKLKVRGAGSAEPLVSNASSRGRSRNRRVELSVIADKEKARELAMKLDKINRSQEKESRQ